MKKQNTDREGLAHGLGGGAAHLAAELVEVLEVGLVERVTDDLDVHLIQVLLRDAVDEVRRCKGRMVTI